MGRERHFISDDQRLGATVDAKCLESIFRRCQEAAGLETGGILLGRYSESGDRALVNRATGAPRDSVAGPFRFFRGVRGLQRAIDRVWRGGTYYLGEWHFHPGGSATPSGIDIKQMQQFARDPDYQCPEPVLLVVGGEEPDWSLSMTVLAHGDVIKLRAAPG